MKINFYCMSYQYKTAILIFFKKNSYKSFQKNHTQICLLILLKLSNLPPAKWYVNVSFS